jgi:crossover junction endodeoxyribonuclease RuvC
VFDSRGPVLGIDPGLSRCGFGTVTRRRATLRAERHGVLSTDRALPLPERLAALATMIDELIADVRPCALAVERVLFQVNARTAMSVGQASGLALVTAARAGIPVFQYSPNEVKLAVTGDGRADKAAVQQMVTRLLELERIPKPADAADALALAITHSWRDRFAGAVRALPTATTPSAGLAQRVEAALAKHPSAGRNASRTRTPPKETTR